MLVDNYTYAARLAADAACVWFAVWAIRKKYALDYPVEYTAKVVRWSLVVVSFVLALLRQPEFRPIRIFAGILLLAFLCWPNFAYRLVNLFRGRHNHLRKTRSAR